MNSGKNYISKGKPLSQSIDPNKKLFHKKIKLSNPKEETISWISKEDAGITTSNVGSPSNYIGTRGAGGKISDLKKRTFGGLKTYLIQMRKNLNKDSK